MFSNYGKNNPIFYYLLVRRNWHLRTVNNVTLTVHINKSTFYHACCMQRNSNNLNLFISLRTEYIERIEPPTVV